MATPSAPLPATRWYRARLPALRRFRLPLRLRGVAIFESVRARVYLTLTALIVLTLLFAGVVFFFLLGGYEDRLAESTLREISVGASSVSEVEILHGLEEGEQILLTEVTRFNGANTVLIRD